MEAFGRRRLMDSAVDVYAEDIQSIAHQRTGHGILLVSARGEVLMMDGRASDFCRQMKDVTAEAEGPLPVPILKLVKEIAELQHLRSHSKDWEDFKVKRVIRGQEGYILVMGIGLPASVGHDTLATILLTMDVITPRSTAPRRREDFLLTPKERSVVDFLFKGYTNKEIAKASDVKVQTAKEHIKHIMEKTRTTTRTGIIMAIAGPPAR
jgi:DNA-binding NarL/FixJ family response regulator